MGFWMEWKKFLDLFFTKNELLLFIFSWIKTVKRSFVAILKILWWIILLAFSLHFYFNYQISPHLKLMPGSNGLGYSIVLNDGIPQSFLFYIFAIVLAMGIIAYLLEFFMILSVRASLEKKNLRYFFRYFRVFPAFFLLFCFFETLMMTYGYVLGAFALSFYLAIMFLTITIMVDQVGGFAKAIGKVFRFVKKTFPIFLLIVLIGAFFSWISWYAFCDRNFGFIAEFSSDSTDLKIIMCLKFYVFVVALAFVKIFSYSAYSVLYLKYKYKIS